MKKTTKRIISMSMIIMLCGTLLLCLASCGVSEDYESENVYASICGNNVGRVIRTKYDGDMVEITVRSYSTNEWGQDEETNMTYRTHRENYVIWWEE